MKLGLNFVTDIPKERIIERAALAEKLGFESLWVGETLGLKHPFEVMPSIANKTKHVVIGTSILSIYTNNYRRIVNTFLNYVRRYGDRFIIGIGLGDKYALKLRNIEQSAPLSTIEKYYIGMRNIMRDYGIKIPVIIGTSAPKMAQLSCKICNRVLLNMVYPEYIEWIIEKLDDDCEISVIGPSLLKGDIKNLRALRVASAIVLRGMNEKFLEEFGLLELARKLNNILNSGHYDLLKKYDDILLARFSMYGNIREVYEKIVNLKKIGVYRVIFGPPLYRNMEAISIISKNLICL